MNKIKILFLILLFTGSLSAQVDLEKLDRYIDKAVKDFDAVGLAVAVVKDSQVVFSEAYGYADKDKEIELTTGSLFNIASCTKAFTAAVVAKLVDEGKLNWDDKVVDHIPYFELSDMWITDQLNIVDILSHRSGLKTFAGDLLWYHTGYSNEEIIRRMKYLPVENDFRSEFGYQNNMFMIAGEIAGKAAGKPWYEYLQNEIYDKLDMKETRVSSISLDEGQDIAYPHIEGKRYPLAIEKPDAAGSSFSNIEELSNWVMMLLNEGKFRGMSILSEKVIEDMFTPRTFLRIGKTMSGSGVNFHAYGLGWHMYDLEGRKVIYHDGGMPGYISRVMLVPEEDLGIVVLTNGFNPLPQAVSMQIVDLYLGNESDWAADYLERVNRYEERDKDKEAEKEAARVEGTSPSLELTGYTGKFNDESYGEASIELVENKLILTLPAEDVFVSEMNHWHYDTFRIKFKDEYLPEGFVTFDFNSKGEVTAFKIDLPNPDFHFNDLYFKKID